MLSKYNICVMMQNPLTENYPQLHVFDACLESGCNMHCRTWEIINLSLSVESFDSDHGPTHTPAQKINRNNNDDEIEK